MSSRISDFPALDAYSAQAGRASSESPADAKPAGHPAPALQADNRINVSLSPAGLSLSSPSKARDQDIEDSDLPTAVKEALKRIRELRAALQEKLRELNKAMADHTLPDDQRRQRIDRLQVEVSTLISALAMANNALVKLLNDSKLSSEQKMTAGLLSMAGPAR